MCEYCRYCDYDLGSKCVDREPRFVFEQHYGSSQHIVDRLVAISYTAVASIALIVAFLCGMAAQR